MLPGPDLPASLLAVLAPLRWCFTAPGYGTFCGLVAGRAAQRSQLTRFPQAATVHTTITRTVSHTNVLLKDASLRLGLCRRFAGSGSASCPS
jgi:hypothetical protein